MTDITQQHAQVFAQIADQLVQQLGLPKTGQGAKYAAWWSSWMQQYVRTQAQLNLYVTAVALAEKEAMRVGLDPATPGGFWAMFRQSILNYRDLGGHTDSPNVTPGQTAEASYAQQKAAEDAIGATVTGFDAYADTWGGAGSFVPELPSSTSSTVSSAVSTAATAATQAAQTVAQKSGLPLWLIAGAALLLFFRR